MTQNKILLKQHNQGLNFYDIKDNLQLTYVQYA